ncbi:hypothetical protein ABU553_004368 [Yersinia enterocolitica]
MANLLESEKWSPLSAGRRTGRCNGLGFCRMVLAEVVLVAGASLDICVCENIYSEVLAWRPPLLNFFSHFFNQLRRFI